MVSPNSVPLPSLSTPHTAPLLPFSLPFPPVGGRSQELEVQKAKISGWDKKKILETAMT